MTPYERALENLALGHDAEYVLEILLKNLIEMDERNNRRFLFGGDLNDE